MASSDCFLLLLVLVLGSVLSGCFGTPEDRDGLTKDTEQQGWDVTVTDGDGQQRTYHVTSSPFEADEDRDGAPDDVELLEQTDPRAPDTDGDGLLDHLDIQLRADDPLVEAWRTRGVAHEVRGAFVLFFGERSNIGEPRRADTDADGVLDGLEVAGYTFVRAGAEPRHVRTDVHRPDTDNDGLPDGLERRILLNGADSDSDGDGVGDQADVNPWVDVVVAFEVANISLNAQRTVWFEAHGLDQFVFASPGVEIGPGHYTGTAFDRAGLDPVDDGGSVAAGRHNVSFVVTLLEQRDAAPDAVDVFSALTGRPWVEGRLNALSGTMYWVAMDDSLRPWPPEGFVGADGSVDFEVVLESPAASSGG